MKNVLLLFAFIISVKAAGQSGSWLSPRQKRILDSISLQDVPPGAPGIATGIVRHGQIVYRTCAGYANLKDSTPITGSSRFNIASNAKQFTALAILILIDQNKIHLDDDIRLFFPKLLPDLGQKISIENLLTHTSGIRDVYDLWALKGVTWWKHTFDNDDVLRLLYEQRELNFSPGTQYSYSNSNYVLLAGIVGRVTGKPFAKYARDLFGKLNMPNTAFEPDHKHIHGPVALPYFNFSSWTGYSWLCNIYGDGNLFSTLDDQLQWERTLQTGKSEFLSGALLKKCQQLTAPALTDRYGYGVEFGSYKNIPYRFHEGSTGAWKATTIRFPKDSISIITLTNSGKTIPYDQTRQLADVVLNLGSDARRYSIAPKTQGPFVTVEEVTGIYQDENNFTFRFEKRDTSLYLIRSGRNDIRLVREGPNVFHQWNDAPFKQQFTKNATGAMEVTAYYTEHAPYTLTRPQSDWRGFLYESINGKYTNIETQVTTTIRHTSGTSYNLTIGKNKYTANLVTPTRLIADDYSFEITDRKISGRPAEVLLNGNRIKKVRFIRTAK